MFRRIVGAIQRWFRRPRLSDIAERVSVDLNLWNKNPIIVSSPPYRGMLRSVDRRLGYRKERSQARNWKRRWKR